MVSLYFGPYLLLLLPTYPAISTLLSRILPLEKSINIPFNGHKPDFWQQVFLPFDALSFEFFWHPLWCRCFFLVIFSPTFQYSTVMQHIYWYSQNHTIAFIYLIYIYMFISFVLKRHYYFNVQICPKIIIALQPFGILLTQSPHIYLHIHTNC